MADSVDEAAIASAIESILLVAAQPVSIRTFCRLLDVDSSDLNRGVDYLLADQTGSGIRLQQHSGTLQLITAPENADVVRRFLEVPRQPRLSRASLETLSIVAYNQPVTRGEIEEFRGVNVDRIIGTLVARGWIEECGRRMAPGRPVEYGTTDSFLGLFGLSDLSELPAIDLATPIIQPAKAIGLRDEDYESTDQLADTDPPELNSVAQSEPDIPIGS